jgi:anti-sigma factor RsiW
MDMHPNDTAINEYVEGSLDSRDRADIERHLATCVSCRQTVEDLREILRATRTLEPQLAGRVAPRARDQAEPPVARRHRTAGESVVPALQDRAPPRPWKARARADGCRRRDRAAAAAASIRPAFRDARRVPARRDTSRRSRPVASELRLAPTH